MTDETITQKETLTGVMKQLRLDNSGISIEENGDTFMITNEMYKDLTLELIPVFKPLLKDAKLPMSFDVDEACKVIRDYINLTFVSPVKLFRKPDKVGDKDPSNADPDDEEEVSKIEEMKERNVEVAYSGSWTIEDIIKGLANSSILDPTEAAMIGKKSIYTYRMLFFTVLRDAKVSMVTAKLIVQVTMSMKTRKKILAYFNTIPGKTLDKNYPLLKMFFEKHCQDNTTIENAKMPTVKIPDSVPDICAIIFVQSQQPIKSASKEIAEKLVKELWASSIFWSEELQAKNKESTKMQWNSWAKTAGTKIDRNGKVLGFDEEIYSNSENDKIPLMNLDGTIFPH